MPEETCCAPARRCMILACSGGSNVGQLSNRAAVELTKEGFGLMYCLAGIGAAMSGFVQSAKDVDEIVDAGHWAFAASFGPAEIGRATGLPLLKEIVGRMDAAAGGKDGVKYVLYSAHDSTILSELSALGAPAAEPPHYSSRLNFLLFDEGERKFVVKTVYNGATVAVKGCGPEFCTLEQFLALAERG